MQLILLERKLKLPLSASFNIIGLLLLPMTIIQPRLISGEIMTLIEEADEKIILITPYFKIKSWQKMLNSLNSIKTRKIACEVYIRENELESLREVRSIGFEPTLIPNLHTKLYINEKTCIVSSMNILLSSDTNSLDIGLKTETKKEYEEIWNYYLRYIKKASHNEAAPQEFFDWKKELEKNLSEATKRRVYVTESANNLQIQTSNKYEAFITKGKFNQLHITGILSGNEFDYALKNRKSVELKGMRIDYTRGDSGHYNMIEGTLPNLKSGSINKHEPSESRAITSALTDFILGVEQLKKRLRNDY